MLDIALDMNSNTDNMIGWLIIEDGILHARYCDMNNNIKWVGRHRTTPHMMYAPFPSLSRS